MALSKNAEKIDKAIDQIDAKRGDDTEARLLVVRRYSVYSFWLVERQEVYVFSKPSHFKRLPLRKFLSEVDFLRALQGEIEEFKARTAYSSHSEETAS